MDWPGDEDNPRREDHALALFPDDEWNRALPCPRSRVSARGLPENTHRCRFEPTTTITLGAHKRWGGLVRSRHEHDGMWGITDDMVLVDAKAAAHKRARPRVVRTLTTLSLSVVDCGTTLTMRRFMTADVDGDGTPELCVESIVEEGLGLFFVMDLEDTGQRWIPIRRTRTFSAFSGAELRARPDLASKCPTSGYNALLSEPLDRAFAERESIQGDAATAKCPPTIPDACGLVEELCP